MSWSLPACRRQVYNHGPLCRNCWGWGRAVVGCSVGHMPIQVMKCSHLEFPARGRRFKGPSGVMQRRWGSFAQSQRLPCQVSACQDSFPRSTCRLNAAATHLRANSSIHCSELLATRLLNPRPTSWAVKVSDKRNKMIVITSTVLTIVYNKSETIVPKLKTREHGLLPHGCHLQPPGKASLGPRPPAALRRFELRPEVKGPK